MSHPSQKQPKQLKRRWPDSHRGPTTDIARRYGCGGGSVASRQALTRERDDLRANRLTEGQPTQTVLALGSPEQECVNRDGHSDRGSRLRSSEKPGAIRTILTTLHQRRARYGLRGGTSGRSGPPRSPSEVAGPHQGLLKFIR